MSPDAYGTPELFLVQGGGCEQMTGEERQRPLRAVAWGNCPTCSATRVGFARQAEHLVWKDHAVTTWSGARVPCRTSGVRLCDAPQAVPPFRMEGGPALCPHPPG